MNLSRQRTRCKSLSNANKMKIAHVIDSLSYGGAQRLEVTFAQAIQAYPEHSMRLVSLRKKYSQTFTPMVEAEGVPVDHILSTSKRELFDFRRFRALVRHLRQEQFDIVHTHLLYANILGTLAAKLAGIPVVTSLHNEAFSKNEGQWRRKLETRILNWGADALIAVGKGVEKAEKQRFPTKKMVVIPNAVATLPKLPPDARRAIREKLVGNPNRPILIAVGSLSMQKAYDDMLQAFLHVRAQIPDVALLIAGGGRLADHLLTEIKRLSLENQVYLLGRRDDIPDLLGASDLYVLSSHWEGLPIAVLEAMSAGLPIVATAVGDVPDVVIDGAGYVVPSKNPVLLAEKIIKLLKNTPLRESFGTASRLHVEQNYASDLWFRRIVQVYHEAVGTFPLPTLGEPA